MEYHLVSRKDTPVVGYTMTARPHDPQIPKMWERIHANGDFRRLMEKSRKGENFGLCIMGEGLPEGCFTYMIAVDCDPAAPVDADMRSYLLKGGNYAVFRAPSIGEISDWFKKIYQEWMPSSPYRFDDARGADFEYYFMDGADVACSVYIPVVPK